VQTEDMTGREWQTAFYLHYTGATVQWARILPLRLADWYTCALFTPLLFWLVRRYPIERAAWRRTAAIHLGATSVIVVAKYALYVQVARLIMPQEDWLLDQVLAGNFASESFAFWALLGIIHAIEYQRHLREREVQAVRLEARVTEARLDALTAQIHPHFLFNTLHAVQSLMRRDVDAADEMLTHLGDLLHRTLAQSTHEVPVTDELELLRHYVEIMQIRFGDRLTFSVELDPAARAARVPHLILQPLVENAISHGIARRPGPGRVGIAVKRLPDGELEIRVTDDGVGLDPYYGREPREGVGLRNVRERLRELYGTRQSLELHPRLTDGLCVVLRMPFRSGSGAAPAAGAEA
jgi:two-component system LytT family sensor kinase